MHTQVSCHENIPHCFGVFLLKHARATSLHLLDGQPLNLETALLKNKPFTIVQWINFMYQVGDAIQHVHCKGIVHNDIKLNDITLGVH